MRRMLSHAASALVALAFSASSYGEIVVAQVAPFSGPLAPTGIHTRAGAQLCFDAINAAGGIHGQKIRLVIRDDAYKADETVRQAREVIETAHPLALFGFAGTGNVEALLREDVLAAAGIPLITVRSGATSLSNSRSRWLFLTRASYADEIDKAIRQYAGMGYRRLAVLYQNDPYGQDGMASVKAVAGRHGAVVVAEAGYEKNTTDVAAAAKALANAKPHAVIMVSNTAASAEFVRLTRAAGNQAQLIALSVNDAAQIVERIGAAVAHGLAITQVAPDPADRSVPLSREVMENFNRFKPEGVSVNHALLEGYLGAKVLIEGLRRAGPNPTRKTLRDALERIANYDAGGMTVNFSETSHAGVRHVDISIIARNGRLLK